jgi:transcriptional regulator with XRE-family HTH domain
VVKCSSLARLVAMGAREILASNLRGLRRERGLSQEELAHRADIDRTYISALERGVYSATVDILDRLAAGLDVDVWELLKA